MKKNNNFENNLNRLKVISEKIENDDLDFDESIKLFEEGMELTQKCKSILDDSELKIQKIIDKNGSFQLKEFKLDS